MRFAGDIILIAILLAGAYFFGVHRGSLRPAQTRAPDPHTWHPVQHQDEGPVCFQSAPDGGTLIRVTPSLHRIVPSCFRTHYVSASVVLNQADMSIQVQSYFSVSHRSGACVTMDTGDYPSVLERLGDLEPGEYRVIHGDTVLGTIELPVPAPEHHSQRYTHCLSPPELVAPQAE